MLKCGLDYGYTKMMSKTTSLKILSLILVLLCLGCSEEKKDPAKEVQKEVLEFFRVLKEVGVSDAYYETHPKFQSATPMTEWYRMKRVYTLEEIENLEIQNVAVDRKNVGLVKGDFVMKDTAHMPVELKLLQHEERWKVIFLDMDLKGLFESRGMVPPNLESRIRLAQDQIRLFHKNAKKFHLKEFYDQSSRILTETTNVEQLNRTYAPLMVNRFLNEDMRKATVTLDARSGVLDTGVLFIKGRLTTSYTSDFEMEFLYEEGRWKIYRFEMELP